MLEQRRKQGAPAKGKKAQQKAQQNAQQEGAAIKCRSTADIKHKNRQKASAAGATSRQKQAREARKKQGRAARASSM